MPELSFRLDGCNGLPGYGIVRCNGLSLQTDHAGTIVGEADHTTALRPYVADCFSAGCIPVKQTVICRGNSSAVVSREGNAVLPCSLLRRTHTTKLAQPLAASHVPQRELTVSVTHECKVRR